jgi:hypothetical protein
VLGEHIYEQSCQEDICNEDRDETLVSIISLDEGEVLLPPTHEDEEMINRSNMDDPMEDPSYMVDQHIDDFMHVGRRRWGVGCIVFYGDPTYDFKCSSQAKEFEFPSSEDWS